MSNTINVNYMSRAYGSFLKTNNANKIAEKGFEDNVEEEIATKITAADIASDVKAVSKEDMTMEEYKQYIYDEISSLPMHPSRMQDSISIQISEAGFEAMKNDPEYEKWVLDWLGKDFMTYNPWTSKCGGAYCVKYIGATKEEYHGESWYAGYNNGSGKSLYNERSQNSFWERRAEESKRLQERNEELAKQRAIEKRRQRERLEEEYLENLNFNRGLLNKVQISDETMEEMSSVIDYYAAISGTVDNDI